MLRKRYRLYHCLCSGCWLLLLLLQLLLLFSESSSISCPKRFLLNYIAILVISDFVAIAKNGSNGFLPSVDGSARNFNKDSSNLFLRFPTSILSDFELVQKLVAQQVVLVLQLLEEKFQDTVGLE
jgi:hypothetical protein